MEFKVISKYRGKDLETFKREIERQIDQNNDDVVLTIRKAEFVLRGVDPPVLIAIVGTLGTGLGALISGILQIIKQSATKKIMIQSKEGSKIEVPADISEEKLSQLIEKLKNMDSDNFNIYLP